MIHRVMTYFKDIPSMYVDGTMKVTAAILSAMIISLTSDTADKYIAPFALWLMTQIILWVNAGITTIIAFRSTSFSKHTETKKKEKEYETQMFQNTNPNNTTV